MFYGLRGALSNSLSIAIAMLLSILDRPCPNLSKTALTNVRAVVYLALYEQNVFESFWIFSFSPKLAQEISSA